MQDLTPCTTQEETHGPRFRGTATRQVKQKAATGGQGKGPNRYGEAHYLALDAQDNIYVADTLNWNVQKLVRA